MATCNIKKGEFLQKKELENKVKKGWRYRHLSSSGDLYKTP